MVKFCNNHKSHKKSTRISLKQKYSIQKKVKEHNTRMRAEARKMKNSGMIKKSFFILSIIKKKKRKILIFLILIH